MSKCRTVKRQRTERLGQNQAENHAPLVVASGGGILTEKIIEAANEEGTVVYEDDSLSSIRSRMKAGREVPEELFRTVTDIYLYFLKFTPKEDA